MLFVITAFACGGGKDAPTAVGNSSPVTANVERPDAININTATAEELQRLPHVGAKTAKAIIEFRERRGGFRRPAELMLVDGISDKRFRAMRPLIAVK